MSKKTKSKKLNNSSSSPQAQKIGKVILQSIGATALITSVIVFPGLAYLIKWVDELIDEKPWKVHRSFRALQKSGAVKVSSKGRQRVLILTPKGRRRLVAYQLSDLRIEKTGKWDGRWRIVMFDIPEAYRSARDNIRRHLIRIGFATVQKSVFISPYSSERVVEVLRNYYQLRSGEIYTFIATAVEGEDELRKYFKL